MGRARAKEFGERVAELRGRRPQREIGDAMGVSASAVGQWEKGTTTPLPDRVFVLEDVLGANRGELAAILGYARPEGPPAQLDGRLDLRGGARSRRGDRLSEVELRLARLEAKVDELLERLPPVEGSR